MDSGSRVRAGCSLRHCSNRWLSSNKSSGVAVCCWGMSPTYSSLLRRVTHYCRKLTVQHKGAKAFDGLKLTGGTLNQEFQKFGGILRNVSTVLSAIGIGGGVFALIFG